MQARGGAEEEGRERESQADSVLSTDLDLILDLMTLKSRAEQKSSLTLNQLRHPGDPRYNHY